jgi:hypothetical protein
MIINPYIFFSFDTDALAFFSAAGITDNTQKLAVDKLVKDLKSYGLWTKMYAIYPFVGGSATTHKFNLKNPVDSDAAYRLIFNGAWVHSSTGILGNGTSTYVDTKLGFHILPQNNAHVSLYCRTDTTGNIIDMGAQSSSANFHTFIDCKLSGSFIARLNTSGLNNASSLNSDAKGFYQVYRTTSNQLNTRRNLATVGTFSNTTTTPGAFTYSYYIGNVNYDGSPYPGYYSNREYSFASFGEGFSDSDSTNFYNSVQTFQTSLSRQI